MPYITQYRRDIIDNEKDTPNCAGELNYFITKTCLGYLEKVGLNYQTLCEIEGVLSHVSKELYRRITIPYENKKIHINGDIEEIEKFELLCFYNILNE